MFWCCHNAQLLRIELFVFFIARLGIMVTFKLFTGDNHTERLTSFTVTVASIRTTISIIS